MDGWILAVVVVAGLWGILWGFWVWLGSQEKLLDARIDHDQRWEETFSQDGLKILHHDLLAR